MIIGGGLHLAPGGAFPAAATGTPQMIYIFHRKADKGSRQQKVQDTLNLSMAMIFHASRYRKSGVTRRNLRSRELTFPHASRLSMTAPVPASRTSAVTSHKPKLPAQGLCSLRNGSADCDEFTRKCFIKPTSSTPDRTVPFSLIVAAHPPRQTIRSLHRP